jgi:RHS repeat-associated protein
MEPMQSDSAIAIDRIPSGVGRVLGIPDVSGFRRLASGYAASSDSYTFTREYGDYLGTGKTDSADLLWVVQHFNEPVPAGDWFMDVDDNGEITSAELLAVIQNFNHGFTGGLSSTDPILQGASQTAGVGTGEVAAPFVPREYYYSSQQQLLEEYAPVMSENDSGTPSASYSFQLADQYVWGLAYQNELIERDALTVTTTGGSYPVDEVGTLGMATSFTTQRLYALQDANHNVAALVGLNSSGTAWVVLQRFDYTPYGTQTPLSSSGATLAADAYSFAVGFQGMVQDPVTQNWDSETRVLRSSLDIWMTQEPFGPWYIDGMNLNEAFGDNPVTMVDPSGLAPFPSSPLLPDPNQRPPGWDPSWPTGVEPYGRPYVQNPNNGVKYYPHPEDNKHWPHYDTSDGNRYPEKCEKPRNDQDKPQKKRPYGDQSDHNPWNDIVKQSAEAAELAALGAALANGALDLLEGAAALAAF